MNDTRNIHEKYRGWEEALIRKDIKGQSLPFAVAMTQIAGDFNFSNIVRTCNALGAREIFYIGKKKWDKRGAVGSYIYSRPVYFPSWEEFIHEIRANTSYKLVALEQSDNSVSINTFPWPASPCIIVGEENAGLSEAILGACDAIVEIPQRGSVRSLNAASAAAIAIHDFIVKRG